MNIRLLPPARLLAGLLMLAAFDANALLEGQPFYDYYNRASHPPNLLDSVRINHLQVAQTRYRSKDPNRLQYVEGDLRYVLNYFPNHPQALFMLVGVALEEKKPKVIEEFLADAIQTFPNTPSTWTIKGIYEAKTGRYGQAIASYKHALQLDPQDMQTHYDLGLAYLEAKQPELANRHAQFAYRLGAPLPGLRDKLTRAGAWKPDAVPENEVPTAGSPSASGGEARAAEVPLPYRK